jgi:hypothetical protein
VGGAGLSLLRGKSCAAKKITTKRAYRNEGKLIHDIVHNILLASSIIIMMKYENKNDYDALFTLEWCRN